MNIKQIAIQCGFYYREGILDLGEMSDYTATTALEQFAQAVIAAYVAEQKPVEAVSIVNMQYEYVQSFDCQMLVCSDDVIETLYAIKESK